MDREEVRSGVVHFKVTPAFTFSHVPFSFAMRCEPKRQTAPDDDAKVQEELEAERSHPVREHR